MMLYSIHKVQEPTRKPWLLLSRPDTDRVKQIIGSYETKREAMTVARLLAGRTGKIEE